MSILEGALNSATIQSVLEVLISRNPASTWLISDGRDEKVIYFSTGGIRLYASEGRKISRLGDHLIRSGLVSPEQLQIAQSSLTETNRESLEEALERLEFLPRARFQEAIARLISCELWDVPTWENAIFEFYEGNPPPQIFDRDHPALHATLDVRELAGRIKEWNQEWSLLKSKLYSERLRIKLAAETSETADPAAGDPAPAAKEVLRCVDGQRNLRELALAAGREFPEVAREVREWMRTGVVRGTLVPVKDPSTPAEVVEEIERLERALDKAINTILIHRRIAIGYEKIHENDRASEHYHVVGNLEADAGRIFKALENYRKAMALSPQNLDVHESLIRRLQDWGEEEKALEEITSFARKLFSFGFFQRAFDVLHGVAAKISHLFDLRILMGDILMALGRQTEALKEYMGVARDMKKAGALDGVEELYAKVLALSPDNQEARAGLFQERCRRVGKAVVWTHRISSLAAALLFALWIAGEVAGRVAWAGAEGAIHSAAGGRDFRQGLEKLWDIGRSYPAALLEPTLLATEMDLFKDAFWRREREMERGFALKNEGKFEEARASFQAVLESEPFDFQVERASDALREVDAAHNETRDLRRNEEFFLNAGAYEDAFVFARRIIEKHPEMSEGLRVPFCVRSAPGSADVRVNGTVIGRTPLWMVLPYPTAHTILVEKKGFRVEQVDVWGDLRGPYLDVKLKKS